MKKEKILLFIPMYNCVKQIPRVIAKVKGKPEEYISEVIIVDNGSTDGSREAAIDAVKSLSIKTSIMLNADNYSLGGSHKVAFNYARKNNFDYIIVLHGDDQGNIDNMISCIEKKLHHDADCLLGARFMKGSKLIGYSKIRIMGNVAFNLMASIVTLRKVYDLGSGLNMYNVSKLDDFYLSMPNTLLFNAYMLLYCIHNKFNIVFFPIEWSESDQLSNAKLFKVGKGILYLLFSYLLNKKNLLKGNSDNELSIDYISNTIFSN